MNEQGVNGKVVAAMFEKGMQTLTGKPLPESFKLFFSKDDVVGIKVNPVGAGLISTRLEVVDAVIAWLRSGGIPAKNIVIWDRFDYMLADAGFTAARYPGIGIEGLQTMDEAAAEGKSQDDSRWLDKDGRHVSEKNFDLDAYYFADIEAPQDKPYLNQHVFNGKYSYFGKLLTKKLTKIINVPVFKNTGNGISMATKNLGYGAVCNTSRLHKPLFFDVCTEVLAFPADARQAGAERHRRPARPVRRRPRPAGPGDLVSEHPVLRQRSLRPGHDLPQPAAAEAQGDERQGERAPDVHRVPALRPAPGPGHRRSGQDRLRPGLRAA